MAAGIVAKGGGQKPAVSVDAQGVCRDFFDAANADAPEVVLANGRQWFADWFADYRGFLADEGRKVDCSAAAAWALVKAEAERRRDAGRVAEAYLDSVDDAEYSPGEILRMGRGGLELWLCSMAPAKLAKLVGDAVPVWRLVEAEVRRRVKLRRIELQRLRKR